MNTNMPAQALKPTRKQRFGLMKARIGSRHNIKNTDGVVRQFEVRELARHSKANKACVCLYCKKVWDTEEDMIESHPETNIMVRQEESHVYCWWSEDPIDKSKLLPTDEKTKKHSIDFTNIIGFLSDEE